ncbi:MAG: UDP-N-acetylmuramoyl-L-alanine--D-glutamate ligase [Clostridiales bacterium]|jgi:UDP-N-acetylmuramoylalanine--D-glutamate ligase|nr:UDP-N-acetylmuramoyl-L-alanine--D-glutamate ligase [Clostridiales bacterium]
MDFKGKRTLVCGAARSGVAAAKLLASQGASVTLQDLKAREKIAYDLEEVEKVAALYLGKNPDEILEGFDLVVISPGMPAGLPFLEKARGLGISVIGEIELAYLLCPCPIIAITGTNGKTTTTALVGAICKRWNPKTEIVGNIGVPFAEKVLGLDQDSLVVAEISSFQLETTDQFKPLVSAVLNVTPDHLDRHKTMEGYARAKQDIGKRQDESGFMILNYDDLICRSMKTSAKTVFFSRAKKLEEGYFLDGSLIKSKFGETESVILDMDEMNIFGNHNIENTLAAVACCASAGVPLDIIKEGALSFTAVAHRIEFVRELDGVKYYNDSKATNTDAAIKAIEAMKQPIVLIGGGYDKHSDYSDWIKAFPGKVKRLVVLGQVAEDIIKACDELGFKDYQRVQTFEQAVFACRDLAEAGDCVLLSPACASWDMFKDFEQRGDLFKELVKKL